MDKLKDKYLKIRTVRAEVGSYSTGGVEIEVPELETINNVVSVEHEGTGAYFAKYNGTGTDDNDAKVVMMEQGASSLSEVGSATSLSSEYVTVTVEGY